MSLMEEIQYYIKDEQDANATYSRMAGDADDAGMHKTAQILRGMAADELRHKEMLEGMYYKPEFGPVPEHESSLTDEISEAYKCAEMTGKVTVSAFSRQRPFPQTDNEWEDLGFDIEAKLPVSIGGFDLDRQTIRDAVATITGKRKEGNVEDAKRWLIQTAGALAIG